MSESITIVFGRTEAVTAGLKKAISALNPKALREFFHSIDTWAATVSDGRKPLRTMNHRYEIFVMRPASPAPYAVGAFDTTTREFVVCALLPDRVAPPMERCAQLCATGLGVTVESLQ